MDQFGAYAGLFLEAAVPILPMQSEAVMVALLLDGEHPAWLLVVLASIGNVMAAIVTFAVGRVLERISNARWFPVNHAALARAQRWYHRYGRWSLLLSWAPFVGDPLLLVAGVMRENLWSFVLLVTIAKTGRYVVLALLTTSAA